MTHEGLTAVLIYEGVIVREMPIFGKQLKICLSKPLKQDLGWGRNLDAELKDLRQFEYWFVCQKGNKCYYHNV